MKKIIIFTLMMISIPIYILFYLYQNIYNQNINTTTINNKAECINSGNANIYIYMYHYFRDQSQAGKSIAPNSISPAKLEKQINILNQKINNKEVTSSTMSQITQYAKNNCFPNKNIVVLTVDDGRLDDFDTLPTIIKKYPSIYRTLGIIAGNTSTGNTVIKKPFMNQYQIQSLINTNHVDIASHSMTHDDLSIIGSGKLEKEICESKKYLENNFNIHINTLIYPDGKYNEQTTNKAKECGYTRGLSTKFGKNTFNANSNNYFEINRIRVTNEEDDEKLFDFEYQKNKK